VDAVTGEQLDVGVVHEADPIKVDDAEVRRVSFDLSYVDDLVNLFLLLVTQLKCT